MAKKIYDIVPPKVKAAHKEKVRKPRKKVVPEVVTPDAILKDFKIESIGQSPEMVGAPESSPELNVDSDNEFIQKFTSNQNPSLNPNPNPVLMLPSHTRNFKKHFFRWILLFVFIVLVGSGVYFYFSLPQADVQIWPNTQNVSFQNSISLDASLKSVNEEKMIIPARVAQIEKEATQEFLPTGIASGDSRASGFITIYNNVSPASSFTLKIGTHFLSDSGKYFVTLQKVTIPAATSVKGKMVPGSLTVKVEAEEAGSDSNIKPAKFSVPKLSGTPYYYTVWGESLEAMTGGSTGSVKKIVKNDLTTAKEVLTKALFSQAQEELVKSLSQDEVLLDTVLTKNVISASADRKVDAVVEKFNQTAKVKVSGLVFKKSDLNVFVQNNLSGKLSKDKKLLEKSLNTSYVPKIINLDKGTASIDVTVVAKEYQEVNKDILINLVRGRTSDQIKKGIGKMYSDGVSKITINFWPFWVNKAPKNVEKISVEVLF